MLNLASTAVSELFTIPVNDWTAINKRVGEIKASANIKDYISSILAGYPDLLTSCLQWEKSTFIGLINQSNELAKYADEAISNFTLLNNNVKASLNAGNTKVPNDLQQQTIATLEKLRNDTIPLENTSNSLSSEVLTFLNNNIIVDTQMLKYKDTLGTFWAPIGDNINTLEGAASNVTSVWSAITDDLNNTLNAPITVDFAFITSLNIDAAIIDWQNIKAEATAFPLLTNGQENYWTNPF
ncbi:MULTISPECIES: hypothetical protein [unclassified Flavobacterium]|uniref:hypothetical protein n=1 Tax=unclassified Flavobacterium TaxID=196869 RepID=UPI0036068F96